MAVQPVRLAEHSEPQPDFALLRPRPDAYAGGHPGPEDVEVCRRPEGAAYREVRVALPAEHIAPEAFPEVSFSVRDLLA